MNASKENNYITPMLLEPKCMNIRVSERHLARWAFPLTSR